MKIIPIQSSSSSPLPSVPATPLLDGPLQDRRGREVHDLRISVTDRCNFRCIYCMPRSVFGADYPFEDMTEAGHFIDTVPIEQSLREDVAYNNAAKLLGL